MNKKKGFILVALVLLLMGSGTFVFANPDTDDIPINSGGNTTKVNKEEKNENLEKDDSQEKGTQNVIENNPDSQEKINNDTEVPSVFSTPQTQINGNKQNTTTVKPNTKPNVNSGNVENNSQGSNIGNSNSTEGNSSSDNNQNQGDNTTTGGNGEEKPSVDVDKIINEAKDLVDKALNSKDPQDIQNAKDALEALEDGDLKNNLKDKLEKLEQEIKDENKSNEIKNEINKLKNEIPDQIDSNKRDELLNKVEQLKEDINQINDTNKKNELLKEVEELEKRIEDAYINYVQGEITNLEKEIPGQVNPVKKEELLNKLEQIKEDISQISDTNKRNELLKEINELEKKIEDAYVNYVQGIVASLEEMVKTAQSKEDIHSAIQFRDANSIENLIGNIKDVTVRNALQNRLDTVNKVLNDTQAPDVTYKENEKLDGKFVQSISTIKIDDMNTVKIVLRDKDGKEISLESLKTKAVNGEYTLVVTDAAFNETVIHFTIDTSAPEVSGIIEGSIVQSIKNIEITDNNEVTILLNGKEIKLNELKNLNVDGNYTLVVTDVAGNSTTIHFMLDTIAPKIKILGISNNGYYNTDVSITVDDVNGATIHVTKDGKPYEYQAGDIICSEGVYIVYAKDAAGNESDPYTFTIDKTSPTATVIYEKEGNNIIAMITPSEDVTITDNDGSNAYTFMGSNQEFVFEFVDKAGNNGSVKAWTLPELVVSYSTKSQTSDSVVATIDLGEYQMLTGENQYEFIENGTYDFWYIDSEGHYGVAHANVSWITKEDDDDEFVEIEFGTWLNFSATKIRDKKSRMIVAAKSPLSEWKSVNGYTLDIAELGTIGGMYRFKILDNGVEIEYKMFYIEAKGYRALGMSLIF